MKESINKVYTMLKDREINPRGKFDDKGRWYAENSDLLSVRSPSKAWPYSQMKACRTRKYVESVVAKYKCESLQELIDNV